MILQLPMINETVVFRYCTSLGTDLVTMKYLLSNKATAVYGSLDKNENNVPTILQSGICRATIKRGENAKLRIKLILQEERNFSLHFASKRTTNHEYQIVFLKRIFYNIIEFGYLNMRKCIINLMHR